jgi:crossover junction endodeoxyribonuclease RuvC
MIYVGIDPGKAGAIASINSDTMEIDIQPMPVLKSSKSRSEYNLVEMRNILVLASTEGELFVTAEKLQPLPPKFGGGIANYNRGYALALLKGMLTGMKIPYQLVLPRVWQKAMLAGTSGTDTKQRSIIAAQRLFPGQSLLRIEKCRKPDNGYSDALLLAAYGMRTQNHTETISKKGVGG